MANSTTKTINTNDEFVTVASAADFTFTNGVTYTMQVQNTAYIKIADAVFSVRDEKFSYKATSDTLYIKTSGVCSCVLTILEVE